MTTSDTTGKVLHATHETVHVLRFVGEIRHPMGPALEKFLDQLLNQAPSAGLVIDLSETEIIDSTCLGLLARTALKLQHQGRGKATLVSQRDDITEVLRSMSFDRLFNIVGEMLVSGPIAERLLTAPGARDEDVLLDTMLRAHRTLMELSEHNRLQFKEVVEALQRESKAHPREPRRPHNA
jgi:anti-anti-sigma factor